MSRTRRPPSSTGQRSRGSGRGKATAPAAADRARALVFTPVSRETLERLDRFVALLLTWQRTTNLIAPSTVLNLWTRHIADSLQLLSFVPDARIWVDLGAGGGFPGLVIACALADRPGAHVYLVESNHKKAAFLREAQRLTTAPATVHATRSEEFVASFEGRADVVTARALAPLKPLLDQCFRFWGKTVRWACSRRGDMQSLNSERRVSRPPCRGGPWQPRSCPAASSLRDTLSS